MKVHRKRRFYFILIILLGVSSAVTLAIYALGENMNVYLTPSQFAAYKSPTTHIFRIGGIVKTGSFERLPNSLTVRFMLTDYHNQIPIQYTGILPALFREGQGIIVQGKLDKEGRFVAQEVLAKHDEKYMPPGLSSENKTSTS